MSNDPVPTPNLYVDPQMVAFEQQVAKFLPNGASLTTLSLSELRRTVREIQAPAPKDARVSTTSFDVKTSFGEVKTFIIKPVDAEYALPVIFYVHGGGWILGNEFDWKSLLFDLVDRTGFAIVFAEYTFAPEAQFPVQQEQLLDVLQWVVKNGHSKGLKADKIAMVGDSAGGQLIPAIEILNHQRSLDLPIVHQVLMFPLVNSVSLTSTFSQFLFQDGPFITSAFIEEAFQDYYGDKIKERSSILASPILMTSAQAKEFMPSTTIVTAQGDWLRDQGEDFARLLQTAGVPCGVIQGVAILHDAWIFNVARKSPTVELIMIMVAGKLKEVLDPRASTHGHTANGGSLSKEDGHSHKRKRRL